MELLMKTKIYFISLIVLGLILTGCGRKFRFERGIEYPPSYWPYSGNNHGEIASSAIKKGFSGNLNLKWKGRFSGDPIGPLAIGGDNLIACSSTGRVYFYQKKTGKYLGKYRSKAAIQTGLTVIDSLAYFAQAPTRNRLICLNLYNQKTLWSAEIKDITGSPIIRENRLYLASATGWVECRNRITGSIIWMDSVSAKSLAGPSCDGGIVYFTFDDGTLIGFDELTGKMIINVDLKQPLVSKAVVGEMVFISGVAGILSALDKKTGKIIWERAFDWPIWTSPAIDRDKVYVGDNGGLLRALDINDGRTLWTFQAEGVILSAPIIVGDFLIFASLDKNLYCLDKYTGLLNSKWKSEHEIRFPAISDGESIFVTAQDGSIYSLGD
jgi:outer membrane protein assembly factor BamB